MAGDDTDAGDGSRYAVPLDGALIKTLASDTRRRILRHLRKRRMTLSELARALDLAKPTVLDHLRRLDDAGLVHRLEDDRMWVYYELSHRGESILSPARTRVYLAVATAAVALAALLVLAIVFAGVGGPVDRGDGGAAAPEPTGDSAEDGGEGAASSPSGEDATLWFWVGGAAVAGAVVAGGAWMVVRRRRGSNPDG